MYIHVTITIMFTLNASAITPYFFQHGDKSQSIHGKIK